MSDIVESVDTGKPERPTDRILEQLYDDLREAALDKDEKQKQGLVGRVRELLAGSAAADTKREVLVSWLRSHQSQCTDEEELGEKTQKILENICGSAAFPRHRKEFLGDLADRLEKRLSMLDDADAEKLIERLVAVGLGLVFMPYDPGAQQLKYQKLVNELLPEKTVREVCDTLRVPRDQGTVGWVIKYIQNILSKPDVENNFESVTIWSTFLDPRGRVATEDLIVGNRALHGIPIFQSTSDFQDMNDQQSNSRWAPLGIIFAFFPVDGAFHCSDGSKEIGFTCTATEYVKSYRDMFLLGLENEMLKNRLDISEKRTDHEVSSSQDFEYLTHQLISHTGSNITTGFFLALRGFLDGHEISGDARVRERAFLNRLFSLLQLCCLYPKKWAPSIARNLQALQDAAEQFKLRPPLVWQGQGEKDIECRHLYPSGVTEEIPEAVLCSRSLDQRDNGLITEPLFLFRKAINLYSQANQVVDLVVPLIDHDSKLKGYLRVNCLYVEKENFTEYASARFFKLYNTFRHDFLEASTLMADLMGQIEARTADKNIDFAGLKSLLDIRYVVCHAIVRFITAVFKGRPIPKEALDLARFAIVILPHGAQCLRKTFDDLAASLDSFVSVLESSMRQNSYPEVLVVSIWVRDRSYRISHEVIVESRPDRPPEDLTFGTILMQDEGLAQFLRLVAQYLGGTRSLTPTIESLLTDLKEGQVLDKYYFNVDLQLIFPPAPFFKGDVTLYTYVDEMKTHLKLKDWQLAISWELMETFDPIAFDFVEGRIEESILDIEDEDSLRLLVELAAEDSGIVRLQIEEALPVREGCRLLKECRDLVEIFSKPEQPSANYLLLARLKQISSQTPELKLLGKGGAFRGKSGAAARDISSTIPGILLVCGFEPVPGPVTVMRNLELKRAITGHELIFLSQDRERGRYTEHLYRERERRQRWFNHQIKGELGIFHKWLSSVDNGELKEKLLNRFFHLWWILQYEADASFEGRPAGDELISLIELIRRIRSPDDSSLGLTVDFESTIEKFDLGEEQARQMYMLIANLVDNAVETALRKGSSRHVRVTCDESTDSACVILNIYNSGEFMPESFREFLLDYSVDKHPTAKPRKAKGLEVIRGIAVELDLAEGDIEIHPWDYDDSGGTLIRLKLEKQNLKGHR